MLIRLAGLLVASLTLTTLSTPATAATVRNHAPSIRGTAPQTPTLPGQTYHFQPTAGDADGDKLTFSILNKPSWMAFNTRTGLLSGTPNASQVGFYKNVQISVSDGKAVTRQSAFMVYVKAAAAAPKPAVNHAPVIRGTAPRTPTLPGQTYSFQPTATDADGDKITFTIANKPAWMTFDARTGKLSGTPNAQQVGFYKDIEIAATDGEDITPLSAFMVYVKADPASGTSTMSPNVALDWTPPTENINGSALTNLKGYTLHYGQKSKTYTTAITINNPSVLNYVIEGLPKGTYFFAVTAFNTKGAESEYSTELSKTVN